MRKCEAKWICLTLSFPMSYFDPPENRKPKVFWCFPGDQNGALGRNRLKKILRLGTYLTSFKMFEKLSSFLLLSNVEREREREQLWLVPCLLFFVLCHDENPRLCSHKMDLIKNAIAREHILKVSQKHKRKTSWCRVFRYSWTSPINALESLL